MQPTTTGQNRTGAAINPSDVVLMMNAVEELSPYMPIDNVSIENERMKHISNADSVGSIPPPAALLKGSVKKTVAVMNGVNPNLLLDKIGERIAFERTGTRLYDALISKYVALSELDGGELRLMESFAETRDTGAAAEESWSRETPLEVLRRIRNEEHSHFLMLCASDSWAATPRATPCADRWPCTMACSCCYGSANHLRAMPECRLIAAHRTASWALSPI